MVLVGRYATEVCGGRGESPNLIGIRWICRCSRNATTSTTLITGSLLYSTWRCDLFGIANADPNLMIRIAGIGRLE